MISLCKSLVFLLLVTGCAGTNMLVPVADPPRDIRLFSAFAGEQNLTNQPAFKSSGHAVPMVSILVDGKINASHAPLPTNDAEQLVFHQCYRTLTQISLDGTVRPALAARWQSFDKHRRWELTLDPDARFWNGDPVTARSVLASWRATEYRTTTTPSAPNPLRWLQPETGRVRATSSGSLVIILGEPMPDLPAQLAHPALAVRGSAAPGDKWPQGTGLCRPLTTSQGVDLVPGFPGSTTWDTLRILSTPVENLHPDLVLTRSAAKPSGLTLTTLPWDRMYFLVCPPTNFGTTENERRRWTTDLDPNTWSADIAPGFSREIFQGNFLEDQERLCPYIRMEVPAWKWPDFTWTGRTAARDQDLVLYPKTDPIAQGLAEILAEHAGRPLRPAEDMPGRGPLTPPRRPVGGLEPQALGPPVADFEAALQAGRAGAYILPVPRWTGSECRQLANILGRAVWLQEAMDDATVANQPLPRNARALRPDDFADPTEAQQAAIRLERSRVLTPLIITRNQLWIRPDFVGLKVDFQGNLDLSAMGLR